MKNKLIICLLAIGGQHLVGSQQAQPELVQVIIQGVQEGRIKFVNSYGTCIKTNDGDLVQTALHVQTAANKGLILVPKAAVIEKIEFINEPKLGARVYFTNNYPSYIQFSEYTM